MAARPNIVTRAQWGARTTVAGNRGVPWSARRRFIVHWPVMASRDERQWCRDIEAMHARSITSAAAPAYNALCGMSGTLYEGCGLTVNGPASGTSDANRTGIAVCVLQPSTAAGVPLAPVSQAARNSVRALYEWCSAQAGRRLTMNGHRDIVATACPGNDLYAWVRGGMQAQAVAPPPQALPEDEEMICSVVKGGLLHVFVATARAVFVTWQGGDGNWWGAGANRARLMHLCPTIDNRNIVGITASVSPAGVLHLFVRFRDGTTAVTWQGANSSTWSGAVAGRQVAGLSYLAAAP
jgi:hypothetical protein